uniref:Uncharacterized protein n=1 Tax=Anguilla anguilla TaxID=7936 RepID=A0A0E9WZ71_ANGAN
MDSFCNSGCFVNKCKKTAACVSVGRKVMTLEPDCFIGDRAPLLSWAWTLLDTDPALMRTIFLEYLTFSNLGSSGFFFLFFLVV